MNREILFRGKRVSDGKWVEGFYNRCEARLSSTEDHFKNNPRSWIQTVDVEGFAEKLTQVDPSTVGQYTGLTDKNGKRIFEGDIVESADFDDDSGYGVVQWADGAFQIGNDLFNGTFYDNYRGDEFEVIGDIHDNPELLGGNDNGPA